MTREELLSVSDIAEELNMGKATVKFLLKRFEKWLPYDSIDGKPFYPAKTVRTLFTIQEGLNAGLLPSKVEDSLETLRSSQPEDVLTLNPSRKEDIRLSNDGLFLLKSLFHEIGDKQERIAAAHEKRAVVEERKAIAIEKRAEAEVKKADAMNNIAAALQEMNKLRAGDPSVQQIAHQTATVIAAGEADQQDTLIETDDISNTIQNSDVFDEMDTDLSSLLDEDNLVEEFSVVDELSDTSEQELDDTDSLSDFHEDLQIDDLSSLIEKETQKTEDSSIELDDLSALLSDPEEKTDVKMDDLSILLDKEPIKNIVEEPLDNLSMLIDTIPEEDEIPKDTAPDQPEPMNDLKELIDPDEKLDDLSKLIDDSPPLDDLAKLIDNQEKVKEPLSKKEEPEDTPAIKIDISPEEDLEKYKAAVMKIILELKTQGLSAQETTDRLNKNNIKTMSGKPEWSQKAISQIYKFIASAQ